MEQIVYLVVFVALMTTVYGRYVSTRNAALLADAERGKALAQGIEQLVAILNLKLRDAVDRREIGQFHAEIALDVLLLVFFD